MPSTPESPEDGYRKPRTSRPKVRSGCLTCKKRRVKCDETKPECHRCCKFGRKCSGYKQDPPEKPELPRTVDTRTIMPKTAISSSEFGYDDPALMSANTQEFLHFSLFADDEMRGHLRWNYIVLQASHQYSFIQHAIITIGSLSRNFRSATAISDETSQQRSSRSGCSFVLRHYNTFLSESQQAFVQGLEGQRLALIVCLLIICIEKLQGHHQQALSQIQSGTQLLDAFYTSQNTMTYPGFAPYIIEDEIVQQFRMLELEASMQPSSYRASAQASSHEDSEMMPQMPETVVKFEYDTSFDTYTTQHFIDGNIDSDPASVLGTDNIDPTLLSSESYGHYRHLDYQAGLDDH